MTVDIKEEYRGKAMNPGHHNAAETTKSQTGGLSLRQPVSDCNTRDNTQN